MGIFTKLLSDKIIFKLTKKPECYIHVDKIKTIQDRRQVQYNNWCKAKGVFNGSYLPSNPDLLLRKGWYEDDECGPDSRHFVRKSTEQKVRYDDDYYKNGYFIKKHIHWEAGKEKKKENGVKYKYFDRYGVLCSADDIQRAHLMPYDRTFNSKTNKIKIK